MVPQEPSLVQVGRIRAIFWPEDAAAATTLAEIADGLGPWPGMPEMSERPIRLIVAADQERFDSLTRNRLPEWGAGAAFPASNTIVLKLSGDVRRVLRHEMAHLALHSVVRRVPLWFDEGYASRAAGEWDRLEALRVNWALLAGARPTLGQVNRDLRSGAGRAENAYALSTTAVLLLERLSEDRGLAPIIRTLSETPDFDQALRTTHGITLDQFEALWQRDLRKRYGWALIFGSFTAFWTLMAILLVSLWVRRRGRDRERRKALDEGWTIPADEWDASA